MSRRRRRIGIAAIAVGLALAGGAPAGADDAIVYVADGKLWRAPTSGGDAVAIGDASTAPVTDLSPSVDGKVLAVTIGGIGGWAIAGDQTKLVAGAACTGPARMAPRGECILCPGGPTTVVLQRLSTTAKPIELELPPETAQFLGPKGKELLVAIDGELWAVSRRAADKRRKVAPHAPSYGLLASPDGTRAAGRYDSEGSQSVLVFRLDGRASQRKLDNDAHPVAWSPDSQWLLLQGPDRACVVRAVGGEYKCWDGFRAIALSPDSTRALLGKPHRDTEMVLHTADIAGVKPEPPKRLFATPVTAATWIAVPAAPAAAVAP